MSNNNTTGSMVPCYKGDQYYASGPLRNVKINYALREMEGEIKIKDSGEWINTFFYFDSRWIVWEEK